jgi:hypothetical protein
MVRVKLIQRLILGVRSQRSKAAQTGEHPMRDSPKSGRGVGTAMVEIFQLLAGLVSNEPETKADRRPKTFPNPSKEMHLQRRIFSSSQIFRGGPPASQTTKPKDYVGFFFDGATATHHLYSKKSTVEDTISSTF